MPAPGRGFPLGVFQARCSWHDMPEKHLPLPLCGSRRSVSPCVYVNLSVNALDPRCRVFGKLREQAPLEIWESAEFGRFRVRVAGGATRTSRP